MRLGVSFAGWKAMPCQIEECDGEGGNEAAKVCMDHAVCLGASPDNPPPLYLCLYCVDDIRREHSTVEFFDILMPMAQVSATCENKVSVIVIPPLERKGFSWSYSTVYFSRGTQYNI